MKPDGNRLIDPIFLACGQSPCGKNPDIETRVIPGWSRRPQEQHDCHLDVFFKKIQCFWEIPKSVKRYFEKC